MMELTQPCSWLGCSINDLLSSWFLSRWSLSSHAHSFSWKDIQHLEPLHELLCLAKETKLPQQTNRQIPAVFCQVNGLPGPQRSRMNPEAGACRTIRERDGGRKADRFDTRHCWTGSSVLLSHTLKTGFMASRTLCKGPCHSSHQERQEENQDL